MAADYDIFNNHYLQMFACIQLNEHIEYNDKRVTVCAFVESYEFFRQLKTNLNGTSCKYIDP